VPELLPASLHRSRKRRALRALAIPVAIILATGAVAASAITHLPNGPTSPNRAGQGAVDASASAAPAGVAVVAPSGATGSPTPSSAPPTPTRAPRVVYRGSAASRVIALTFDDGWSAANGRLIYQILVRQQVPATFFVNSVWLARDPDLWKAIAQAGFVVGNHTYLHNDVTTMTSSEILRDLQRNAHVWQAITGRPMAALFRPPYGNHTPASDLAAAAAGYPDIVLWDTIANDTYDISDAQAYRNAVSGRAGSILLMHMGPDVTPRILGRVIASYRARGFTFVTVPQLLPALPVAPIPSPPVPSPTPQTPAPAPRMPEIVLRGPS
jgi:peptidoglycan-N-acetylglucosamine deacetylase